MSDEHNIGSGPIEASFRAKMQALARTIDGYLNRGAQKKEIGFILLMFQFGDKPGRCNYISNANRDDVKVLLKEQLAYFEGQSDDLSGTA